MQKNRKKENVVIFGTGSLAQVANFYLTHDSHYNVVAFTIDAVPAQEKQALGLPIVPFEEIEKMYPPQEYKMFIAMGYRKMNKLRAQKYYEAKDKGYELISYICSKSVYWDDLQVGDNCFIFENQTIQPFVKIGNDVIIWSGNHIGHHVSIGDHCFITTHVVISGHTKIGPYSFIGVNATLRDDIEIGRENLIGAGTLILKSTKEKEVYIGKRTKPDERDSSQFLL